MGTALGAAFCAFQRLSGVRRKALACRGAKRQAATGRASRTWGEQIGGGLPKTLTHTVG